MKHYKYDEYAIMSPYGRRKTLQQEIQLWAKFVCFSFSLSLSRSSRSFSLRIHLIMKKNHNSEHNGLESRIHMCHRDAIILIVFDSNLSTSGPHSGTKQNNNTHTIFNMKSHLLATCIHLLFCLSFADS